MRFLSALLALIAAGSAAAADFRSVADNAVVMYDAPSARATKVFVVAKFTPLEVDRKSVV